MRRAARQLTQTLSGAASRLQRAGCDPAAAADAAGKYTAAAAAQPCRPAAFGAALAAAAALPPGPACPVVLAGYRATLPHPGTRQQWPTHQAQQAAGAATLGSRRDTVFALSSAPGRSAVALVRISGPGADRALQRLMHAPKSAGVAGALPPPRTAKLTDLVGPSGDLLDRALVLRFPGPHSFTGAPKTIAGTAHLVCCALCFAISSKPGRASFCHASADPKPACPSRQGRTAPSSTCMAAPRWCAPCWRPCKAWGCAPPRQASSPGVHLTPASWTSPRQVFSCNCSLRAAQAGSPVDDQRQASCGPAMPCSWRAWPTFWLLRRRASGGRRCCTARVRQASSGCQMRPTGPHSQWLTISP